MQDNSDWYRLFSSYWWLLFPLGSAVWGLFDTWARHRRADRALDMLKTYADQGKEPPAALIEALRQPVNGWGRGYYRGPYGRSRGPWIPAFLFAGLAAAFLSRFFFPDMGHRDFGTIFIACIMAGLCLGFLASALDRRGNDRDLPPGEGPHS
jgi:hypothetical protein